jgi:hypothetical protein
MQILDTQYTTGLSAEVNEFYLFHGTSPSGVDGIFNTGFQISLAGSAAGTAFGNGAVLSLVLYFFISLPSLSLSLSRDASQTC